ncbi:MAG: bifunctional diaminohydroxyphosphoribosylaminopyrimidine deaminase/5-amino-6-(5-phosphoribosylamino)uracil reductase RibD [Pseudomonadota bacterium]
MSAAPATASSFSTEDFRWMRLAIGLAQRRVGQVGSNPAVGAVVVKDHRVVGRGATAQGGRPHAEAIALDQGRLVWGADALRGATAYVSLEPCAHYGKTPPCAKGLADAGIARVVCPLVDPDPRVSGRGFAMLREAGVVVDVGLLAGEAEAVNAGFLTRQRLGRPYVTLKMASTLDGRIATQTGESRWITGPAARRRVHLLRAQVDGVLIGAGTARIDDPMLDVRLPGDFAQPVRVITDGSLSLPLTGRLVATARQIPVWLLHRSGAPRDRAEGLEAAGADLIEVSATDSGLVNMAEALQHLGDRGLNRLLCEGGGRIAAALLRDQLVDEIQVFSAGKVIGADGRPVVEAFGLTDLARAHRFALASQEIIGADTLTTWRAVR